MRIASGYTQAQLANAVGARQTDISFLETGRTEPSESLLRALCEVLSVDPMFFARDVDEYAMHECSFRHLQSTPRKLLDEVLARGSLHHEIIAMLANLVHLPPINIPDIPTSSAFEVEQAASAARIAWGIGNESPITNAIRLAEHAGVVVTRLEGTTEKVDAFSRFGAPPVIILASTKSSTSRERFNIAHELGHLIIHRGQITGDFKSEREANRFAAALLLPREAFSREFRSLAAVDWPHLYEMKRRWKVAGSAILHRADELELLSPVAARRLYKQYSRRGWSKGEPYEPQQENPEIVPIALRVAADDYGETLESMTVALGWQAALTENVTGLSIQDDAAAANVKHIGDHPRGRR